MQPRRSMWMDPVRDITAFTILAWCCVTALADSPFTKNDPPQPLPQHIVEAWKKAGAEVGWMRVSDFGSVSFVAFASNDSGQPGDVPAFRFKIHLQRRSRRFQLSTDLWEIYK